MATTYPGQALCSFVGAELADGPASGPNRDVTAMRDGPMRMQEVGRGRGKRHKTSTPSIWEWVKIKPPGDRRF